MYSAASKRKKQNDSKGAAYSVAQSKPRGSTAKGFVDNRPETKRLRQLKAKIQNKRRSSLPQHAKKYDDSLKTEEVRENITDQTIDNREMQSTHNQIAQLHTFQQETNTHKKGKVGQMDPPQFPFHAYKDDCIGNLAPVPFSPSVMQFITEAEWKGFTKPPKKINDKTIPQWLLDVEIRKSLYRHFNPDNEIPTDDDLKWNSSNLKDTFAAKRTAFEKCIASLSASSLIDWLTNNTVKKVLDPSTVLSSTPKQSDLANPKENEMSKILTAQKEQGEEIHTINEIKKESVLGTVCCSLTSKGTTATFIARCEPPQEGFKNGFEIKFIQTVQGSPGLMPNAMGRVVQNSDYLAIDRQGEGETEYAFFGQSDQHVDSPKLTIGKGKNPALMCDQPSMVTRLTEGKHWKPQFETHIVAVQEGHNKMYSLACIHWGLGGVYLPLDKSEIAVCIDQLTLSIQANNEPSEGFFKALVGWNKQTSQNLEIIAENPQNITRVEGIMDQNKPESKLHQMKKTYTITQGIVSIDSLKFNLDEKAGTKQDCFWVALKRYTDKGILEENTLETTAQQLKLNTSDWMKHTMLENFVNTYNSLLVDKSKSIKLKIIGTTWLNDDKLAHEGEYSCGQGQSEVTILDTGIQDQPEGHFTAPIL